MPLPGEKLNPHRGQQRALRAVASIEFTKGIFVALMGLCALLLVHKDAWLIAESLLALFHVNPDRQWAQWFLDFADNVTDSRLWAAARIAFAYSILRFVESYGLWRGRTWAEWFALISGTLLLPLEFREVMRGVTWARMALLIGNLAILGYMLFLVLQNRKEHKMRSTAA